MAKLPYMQFYTADYQADTRCISLAARGAWVDILCTLWRSLKRGQKTLSLEGWAGELARPSAEVKLLLIELDLSGICEMDRENDEQITIKCRRMLREERVRRYALKRLHKHRDASVKRFCNADETPVQRPIYQNQSHISELKEGEEGMQGEARSVQKRSRAALCDVEWLQSLKENAAYTGIDVDLQFRRASAWYPEHNRQLTRRAFVNWLIREMGNKPMGAAVPISNRPTKVVL